MKKYKIEYRKTAVKDIRKLDAVTQKRLGKKIEHILSLPDPMSHAKKLVDSQLGQYRWRVGDYRVVFDLDGSTIVVLRVQHRSEVYKR